MVSSEDINAVYLLFSIVFIASVFGGLTVGFIVLIIVIILIIMIYLYEKMKNKGNEKALHGKIFFESHEAPNIKSYPGFNPPGSYEYEKVFPIEMRTEKLEEANLIIYMIWWSQHVGSYSSGQSAYQIICQIKIYSKELKKNIEVVNFNGSIPPEKIYGAYGSYKRGYSPVSGNYPNEEIKNHFREIKKLIEQNNFNVK